ncbi:hypothetical protein ACNI3Q_00255 [Sphingomonas sp. FW199]|uniref:hypothetical protein n=1 Tax=Sphingomonas sp. FW199 TaxID=3400217 RepID=UPI003CF471AF
MFLLCGSHAQKKAAVVDRSGHLALTAPAGFLGCSNFSQADAFLPARERGAIDWRQPAAAQAAA